MAIAYRAHFALIRNPLVTSDGIHVSAVYGFMRAILKIIQDESPDYLAIALDSKQKTFRHEMYPEYKATREKMPFEMVPQIQMIKDVIAAMKIPLLEIPGYEADDIIGTLAKHAEEKDLKTFMVTGDKDFMQLITDKTFMYAPATGKNPLIVYDKEKVKEKWGVYPSHIIDLLALMGDSSDNIPGIPGVGEKTAVKLLAQYGDFDKVLEHGDEQKNARVRRGLVENKELGYLSKKLVKIDTDVPIDIQWEDIKSGEVDSSTLLPLLEKLEFHNIIRELDLGYEESKPESNYILIDTREKFDQFLQELSTQSVFAFDTETDSLDAFRTNLVGLSFSWEKYKAYYLPVKFLNKEAELFAENDLDFIIENLKPFLEDPNIQKIGHNIKFDASVLIKYGIRVNNLYFDTMIAEYVINPVNTSYKLDNLARHYLQYTMQPIEALIGEKRSQITMDLVPLDKIGFYAAEDADVTWQLYEILKKRLIKLELEKVFYTIEMPLVSVLVTMESNGMFVDLEFLREMSITLEQKLLISIKDIYECAGEQFNINSPAQLSYILYDKFNLPVFKKTKTGKSTNVTVLEQLKSHHPLPEKILNYRTLAKLKSTYVDTLPKLENPNSNRIHSSFNQTVTSTGRLSSTNPNFQNIPIRTDIGRSIRKAFIAQDKDWFILSADYSQVELRVMAHLSGDKELIDAFQNEQDVHSRTASRVFGVDEKDVTAEMRRTAKVINFGIMYGAGPFRIAQELSISRAEAEGIIKAYFDSYSGIKYYIDETVKSAEKLGYVETIFGRRLHIPDINSGNKNLKNSAIRVAINMPVQGSAADLIKLAMIQLQKKLERLDLKSKLISQVHDELIFEVAPDEMDLLKNTIKFEMEHAVKLLVPLIVDLGFGHSWFEAH